MILALASTTPDWVLVVVALGGMTANMIGSIAAAVNAAVQVRNLRRQIELQHQQTLANQAATHTLTLAIAAHAGLPSTAMRALPHPPGGAIVPGTPAPAPYTGGGAAGGFATG